MTSPDLDGWARRHDIIVLEGCDGTGKTTLAAQLAERHDYALVHSTRSSAGTDLAAKYRAIFASHERLVLDRGYISELVYGPLEHGRSRLSRADAALLTAQVTARGGLLVHLTGHPEILASRLAARDGHAAAAGRLEAITTAYREVFDWLSAYATVVTIDTTRAVP